METMGTAMWQRNNPLVEQISDNVCRFDFYQAVRALEGLYLQYAQQSGEVRDKAFPIRFVGNTHLSFYGSPIAAVKPHQRDSEKLDVLVNFFGLTGIDAPMPDDYAELINEQDRDSASDSAMRHFFDIVNHSLIKLRYDVRKRIRTGFRPDSERDDSLHDTIYNLLGLHVGPLRNTLDFKDQALLPYAGILHGDRRSLHGLEVMLNDILATRVECIPLTGRWQPIEDHDQNRLGKQGQNQITGQSLVLGRRVWDPQSRFSIRIEAQSWEVFESFLPLKHATRYQQLADLVEFYTRKQFGYDCILRIARHLVPDKTANPRLSWSCLLKNSGANTTFLEIRLHPLSLWRARN